MNVTDSAYIMRNPNDDIDQQHAPERIGENIHYHCVDLLNIHVHSNIKNIINIFFSILNIPNT